jgi:hypothetical protein
MDTKWWYNDHISRKEVNEALKRVYQPAIAPEQIHALWLLKQQTRRSMTVLLREAVGAYPGRQSEDRDVSQTPGPQLTPTQLERRSP